MIRLRRRDRKAAPPDRSIGRPPRGTADETIAIGLPGGWFGDLYHVALRTSWWRFLLAAIILYVSINIVFALLYLAQPKALAEARPGSFTDAFFFSVQTIATVGYGRIWPATLYANIIATIEDAVGLLFLATATGLTFARVSRPT